MRESARIILLVAVSVFATAIPGHAQFSAEGRAGIAIPAGDAFGEVASAGIGLEVLGMYRATPVLDLYAGFNWTRFGFDLEEEEEPVDASATESGPSLGARVLIQTEGSIQPWIRGGIYFNELEISGTEDGISASFSTNRGLGFELGGGIGFEVASGVVVTPGIRYRTSSPEFELAGGGVQFAADVDVNSFVIDLGAQIAL